MSEQDLKRQLKALKTEKGKASRAIGEARKAGQPVDELIRQVQDISQRIRALEQQLKPARPAPRQEDAGPRLLPPQFRREPLPSIDETLEVRSLDDAAWDAAVEQQAHASIYHGSAIRRVIADSFGHPAHYLAAVNAEGRVRGLLPLIEMNSRLFGHFLVSVPYFNYGGVVAESREARDALLAAAAERASSLGVEHIEYRHTRDDLELPARSEKVAMIRPLPDSAETLWRDIGSKLRAQINKARRNELATRIGREELVEDFYRVFARNMRDLGTPVYGIELFRNMLKYCSSSYIVCVYRNGQPVSGGFLLGWRNTLEIPWASTLREANRFDANMLLYWTVLESAIERGYALFDFGRSSKGASTWRFKKQWGAQGEDLYWHYWLPEGQELPALNPNNPRFRLMVAAWKRLPVAIANLIGPGIVKYIP